jgi:molybdenum cofactor cytidylyltransferase
VTAVFGPADNPQIGAIVLAAGRSTRMGVTKMTLPWGDTTVIGQVIRVLLVSGVPDILVVTGGAQSEVQQALQGLPVREVYNPEYQQGEMLSTFKLGLSNLGDHLDAALVVLGDQPQIERKVVLSLMKVFSNLRSALVVPSFQMRRGHPWLMDRSLWAAALELQEPATLRDFLAENQSSIHYVNVDTPSVLQDLDTPGDYRKYQP